MRELTVVVTLLEMAFVLGYTFVGCYEFDHKQ